MTMEKTWRWFGENDPISLAEIAQLGVEGIVTALHHIPNGEVWPIDEIKKVQQAIESHGMRWSVVESLPVSEGIKQGTADRERLIENYKKSMHHLSACGIDTICYNFMPVLDWARTDIHFKLENGGEGMYFDYPTFAAFDIFILKRPGAKRNYSENMLQKAQQVYANMSEEEAEQLAYNIIILTQGFIDGTVTDSSDYKEVFLGYLKQYDSISEEAFRANFTYFLKAIIPTADELGINMAVHPDDPPFPILGLPRIVGTIEDLKWVCKQYDSTRNGITFCTGSLSARADNQLSDMVDAIGPHIHFAHLRSTQLTENGSFYEANHLQGSVDMFEIVKRLLMEQKRREAIGRKDFRIPFRPDHGTKIIDDFKRKANPGYPLIGRLKGLSEIDGLQKGIQGFLQ